jgi:hypothetical protein
MISIDSALREVALLNSQANPAAAEGRLRSLIDSLSPTELSESEREIRSVAQQFLPKRRTELMAFLAQRLTGIARSATDVDSATAAVEFRTNLRSAFLDLAQHHIYEWSTWYNQAIQGAFSEARQLIINGVEQSSVEAGLYGELAQHESHIVQSGYTYTASRGATYQIAIGKSLSGLQRFLDLPVVSYQERFSKIRTGREAEAVRGICSAMLSGIIEGYGAARLGNVSGYDVLQEYPASWVDRLVFVKPAGVERLVAQLKAGPVRDRVKKILLPLVRAIETIVKHHGADRAHIPLLVQQQRGGQRLDLTLRPAVQVGTPESIAVQCYFTTGPGDLVEFEHAVNTGVALVLAPLASALAASVEASNLLRLRVVDSAPGADIQRVTETLELALAEIAGSANRGVPLVVNLAKRFPLDNPELSRYFRVHRASVRRLLDEHEQDSGIRLWCSVRRSGKTTACLDLGASASGSLVHLETCEHIGQSYASDSFYQAVMSAVEGRRHLSKGFVSDVIEGALEYNRGPSKLVFVLDEYESLFERLGAVAERDRDLRYAVVQPLLNQIVEFARNNLVIFIGQRPDAHYIIADQNQLSPYVKQDSFPLFEYEPRTESEFHSLLNKVMTERVRCDESFIGQVHGETGGHPVLTVNLLTEFFDWLIENKRSTTELRFDGGDFEAFSAERLTPRAIRESPTYELFRQMASQALGDNSRKQTPWLHGVYSLLKRLGRDSSDGMKCSEGDAERLVEDLGIVASDLLRTGMQANFLSIRGKTVRPRIKLLARIVAEARPSLSL